MGENDLSGNDDGTGLEKHRRRKWQMKILLINHYAGSIEMGMEFRPYYFAREWVKMGHKVHIVAADYSHLRTKNPDVSKDFQTERIDGILYHWVKAGRYEGNGVKRALTMLRFVGKLWICADKIVKAWKPDVVITSSTYPLDTYAGQRIARMCGAKLIHEIHDMWPATLTELGGMSRFHPFVMAIQAAENSFCRHSDYVVSLPSNAKEYLIAHGLDPHKLIHIPNGVALQDWECKENLPEEHQGVLQDLKRNGKFVAGYFGGHALSNALDSLLDAAKRITNPKIQFVLVGDGVEKKRLIKRVKQEQIENVQFLPPVSKKMIPALLTYFDCCVMCAADSSLYRFGMCFNKLYDSMMAAKPVLCAIHTPDSVIRTYKCGMMVRPQDAEELAQAVEKMSQLPEARRKQMGENGKQAVLQHFVYDILAEEFASLFNSER